MFQTNQRNRMPSSFLPKANRDPYWTYKGRKALPTAARCLRMQGQPREGYADLPRDPGHQPKNRGPRQCPQQDNSIFTELGIQQVLLHNNRTVCFITKSISQNIRELETSHGDAPSPGNGLH